MLFPSGFVWTHTNRMTSNTGGSARSTIRHRMAKAGIAGSVRGCRGRTCGLAHSPGQSGRWTCRASRRIACQARQGGWAGAGACPGPGIAATGASPLAGGGGAGTGVGRGGVMEPGGCHGGAVRSRVAGERGRVTACDRPHRIPAGVCSGRRAWGCRRRRSGHLTPPGGACEPFDAARHLDNGRRGADLARVGILREKRS